MKKYSKILTVSLIMFVVGLVIVLITFSFTGELYSFSINSRGFRIHSSNFNSSTSSGFNSTNNVVLEEFDSINMVSMSEEIRFIPSNEFRIEYSIDDRFTVEKCYVKNGTLEFYFKTPSTNFGVVPNYSRGYINIYYDQSINNGVFDDFEIVAAFSSIDFAGVSDVNKFKISSVTQYINVNFDFNQGNIDMVSGNINLTSLGKNPSKIEINTVSGDIDVTLSENNVDLNFTSISGKPYVNGEQVNNNYRNLDGKTDISINSVSGDLNVYY